MTEQFALRVFIISLAASLPLLCQTPAATPTAAPPKEAVKTPAPPVSTVYSNPRAGADDPRIGLKGGLYDAGEAAFGLERLASLPKPPGFAPGNVITSPAAAAADPANTTAPKPDSAAGSTTGAPVTPAAHPPSPMSQYGSTNSDLAFSGNHLFVGNYNGINTYDIDNPKEVKLRTSLVCPEAREMFRYTDTFSLCRQKR